MKKLTGFIFLLTIAAFFFSCDDQVPNEKEKTQLNKILININGKDTVMDIMKIELAGYPKSGTSPARQMLSVISAQDGTGFHLDFYVLDTVLQVNKEYPVTKSIATSFYETAVYFRNLNFDAYNKNNIISESEKFYSKVTYLKDNSIKGSFNFAYGNTILVKGTFYTDQLQRK